MSSDSCPAKATHRPSRYNAPSDTVVSLGAGTFLLNGVLHIPGHKVLRGQGANQTILNIKSTSGASGGAYAAAVTMGSGSVNTSLDVSITGGTAKDSTSITVSNASNITVGKYLQITELNNSALQVTNVGDEGACGWCDLYNGTRALGQISEVTAVNNNTITISPGLFRAMSLSPLATPFSSDKYAGVENLQLYANNTNAGSGIGMSQCAYCWVSGIEENYTDGDWVDVTWGYHDVIVNSYFSNAFLHGPGTFDSDIDLRSKTTGVLVQNNILERGHASLMLEWGAAGNVIAYNYMFGNFDSATPNHFFGAYNNHGAHPEFNLSEGNIDSKYTPDGTWGSGSDETSFRDWHTGVQKACDPLTGRGNVSCGGTGGWWEFQQDAAYNLGEHSSRFNLVGAILGSQDMKNLGMPNVKEVVAICGPAPCGSGSRNYDSVSYDMTLGYCGSSTGGGSCDSILPYNTFFAHGVYASADSSVTWSGTLTHALPVSFYLSAKPAWWGGLPWPGIGPDITGGLANAFGHAYNNPAKNCYETVMGGTDGTGSPRSFNANTCYGSVIVSIPPAPTGLTTVVR